MPPGTRGGGTKNKKDQPPHQTTPPPLPRVRINTTLSDSEVGSENSSNNSTNRTTGQSSSSNSSTPDRSGSNFSDDLISEIEIRQPDGGAEKLFTSKKAATNEQLVSRDKKAAKSKTAKKGGQNKYHQTLSNSGQKKHSVASSCQSSSSDNSSTGRKITELMSEATDIDFGVEHGNCTNILSGETNIAMEKLIQEQLLSEKKRLIAEKNKQLGIMPTNSSSKTATKGTTVSNSPDVGKFARAPKLLKKQTSFLKKPSSSSEFLPGNSFAIPDEYRNDFIDENENSIFF